MSKSQNQGAPAATPAPDAPEAAPSTFVVRDRKATAVPLTCRSKHGKCAVTVSFPVRNRRITLSAKACKAFASDLDALTKSGAIVPAP